MDIIISTIHGTFMVPQSKHAELNAWLQANAIRQGQQGIQEVKGCNYPLQQQLLSEVGRF